MGNEPMSGFDFIGGVVLSILSFAIIGATILLVILFNENTVLKERINELDKRKPVIIHNVDNAGGMMAGQITDKEIIEGRYTVTVGAYGKFLVTKEQYESLKVGDKIPDYLKKRGN